MKNNEKHLNSRLALFLSALCAAAMLITGAIFRFTDNGAIQTLSGDRVPTTEAFPDDNNIQHRTSGNYEFDINLCSSAAALTKYLGNEKEIVIPEKIDGYSVESIGESTFEGCEITSVTIPDGVCVIGESAFEDCTELVSITIPDSVSEIKSRAFAKCSSLKEVELPDSMTQIEESIFYYCTTLERIIIPDSVSDVEWTAFWECENAVITYKGVEYAYENNFHFNNSFRAFVNAQNGIYSNL